MTKNHKLIILAFVVVFFVLPLIATAVYLSFIKPDQAGITETVDPISGDTIVDGNTTPETASSTGQIVYGGSNIAPLYGNNLAYTALRNQYFGGHFKDEKIIKINQEQIKKKALVDASGHSTVEVTFEIYIGEDSKDKRDIHTLYDPDAGLITVTTTNSGGEKETETINVNGGD